MYGENPWFVRIAGFSFLMRLIRYNLGMRKREFVVLISGIVGIGLVAGATKDFSVYQGQQSQNVEAKATNPFAEALPYDFWGDYSNAEFWEDNATHEIVWENPYSAAYHYHPAYNGNGHQSFHDYTGAFNLALVNGYSGFYEKHYKAFATSDENVEGFWGLEPDWTLLDVSYYVEDWIVWNSNEVQNYDDYIGRPVTNEDISFEWSGKSIVDDADELSKVLVKDYKDVADNISIGNALTSNYGYLYYFEQQPLSSEGTNIGIPPREDWKYKIYPLDRLILPENKAGIEGKINEKQLHTIFANDFNLDDKFKMFREWIDDKVYLDINRDFIDVYGIEAIEHDINQKYYEIEAINQEHLEINYYEIDEAGDKKLISEEENNTKLQEFEQIEMEVIVSEGIVIESGKFISNFYPNKELFSPPPIPPTPTEDNIIKKIIVLITALGFLFLILFFSFWFFGKKD